MKQTCAFPWAFLVLLLALPLCACKAWQQASPSPAPVPPVTENGAEAAAETAQPTPGSESVRAAYYSALSKLLHHHSLPDGTVWAYDPEMDEGGDQFAICDVDGDGREELILILTSAVSAGQAQYIFDYDAQTQIFHTELAEYPLLTFFDNGIIKALWSHNQGLAGEFWPYTLYRYDPGSDSYLSIGMVDAWDRRLSETGLDGKPFPAEVDASGTGVVYYLMPGGQYEPVDAVDASVYEAWAASCLSGASEISLPFLPLAAENLPE